MSGSFRDLTVYKKAFQLAMEIFEITKKFPSEEKFALVDQLRRSSRSVCRAIAEGHRKRQYPKHFSSKMSDADMENSETQVSLEFALACIYILGKLCGSNQQVSRNRPDVASYGHVSGEI